MVFDQEHSLYDQIEFLSYFILNGSGLDLVFELVEAAVHWKETEFLCDLNELEQVKGGDVLKAGLIILHVEPFEVKDRLPVLLPEQIVDSVVNGIWFNGLDEILGHWFSY